MNSKWLLSTVDTLLVQTLSKQLNIHPVTAKILVNRGITTMEEGKKFLTPRLSLLPDPYDLPDMDMAVDRIINAINGGEKITIYGDYDSDGITATALLVSFLKRCGANVDYYIPNRISEGYGLNIGSIDTIKKWGTSLIVTVDTGTNFSLEISYAKSLDIDVVVTDHHELSKDLPPAIAIVNPKRFPDTRFSELAGVGVSFYLVAALKVRLKKGGHFKDDEPDLKSLLDLVAIGTIADVAPLTGINRTLVKHGLEVLKNTGRCGLRALIEASSTDLSTIDTHTVAFRIAPRINAAGRLGSQEVGLKLLLTEERNEANELAIRLNKLNAERQAIEKNILDETEGLAERLHKRKGIVLWSDKWHAGVIGIVASRLAETHNKPCALISITGTAGRGSVRSIGTFNIMKTLNHCAPALKNYGGHASAGGFDIESHNIDKFYELFEEYVAANLPEDERIPSVDIDAEIDISDINDRLINELKMIEPFGEGNPRPVFKTTECLVKNVRVVGSNHLKLTISDNMVILDAIGFGLGDREIIPGKKYLFAGTPQFNEWNGTTSIQMKLQDIKQA